MPRDDATQVGPFSCFGQRWVILSSDQLLAAFLHDAYGPLEDETYAGSTVVYRIEPPTDTEPGRVLREDALVGTRGSHSATLQLLVWAINRQVIERADRQLVLHSAAADKDGIAVLMPGSSGVGKSTLVTALLDRGFAYLSDETVTVDEQLCVEGLSKPISIDEGAWEVLKHHAPDQHGPLARYFEGQWQLIAKQIAPVVMRSRLGMIVFPRYAPGAGTAITPITPATALRRLVPCTFAPDGRRLRRDQVEMVGRLVSAVDSFVLVHDDLDTACGLLNYLRDVG